MAYSPGYSIDIRPNGDTVRGAFEKYNAEVVKIYGILNTLDDKDITAAELETLKTGPIAGSRVTGTISGYVDISHVTGDIPASSVSGSLTKATISTGSVTGLEAYVQELISQSGSSTDKGDGITTSSLSGNGYAKFNNGLIIQWGSVDIQQNMSDAGGTFPIPFSRACFSISLTPSRSSGYSAIPYSIRALTTTAWATLNAPWDFDGKMYYIAIGV